MLLRVGGALKALHLERTDRLAEHDHRDGD
jgi:hypothetical protein